MTKDHDFKRLVRERMQDTGGTDRNDAPADPMRDDGLRASSGFAPDSSV